MFKNIIKLFIISFGYCLFLNNCTAQELNCSVTVNASQVQETNKTIYETLQRQLNDFINSKKWTNDQFLNQERIECSFFINISERVNIDHFKAAITVQSRRPIYNSSYYSPLMNYQDNDFAFQYVQDEVIEFDEGNVSNNLMGTIGYYIYVILGLDYDSFSPNGGAVYFGKAQNIVNNAQNLNERGWKAFENERNRYWLAENLLNSQLRQVHTTIYQYHRLGFDKMSDNVSEGRLKVLESLKELRTVFNSRPNNILMMVFFNAKADEIVNLFSAGSPDEKTQVTELLTLIDPGNINKYNTIK